MFEFQNNLWKEVLDNQKKYLDNIWKEREAEKLDLQERKEAEKLIIQREKEAEKSIFKKENEAEKLNLLREYMDQKVDLNIQIERLRKEVEQYKQLLLQMRQKCALEFIRAQVLNGFTFCFFLVLVI